MCSYTTCIGYGTLLLSANGGIRAFGGFSLERTINDVCVSAASDPNRSLYCNQADSGIPWQKQIKATVVYPLPWQGISVSAAYQGLNGYLTGTAAQAGRAFNRPRHVGFGRADRVGERVALREPGGQRRGERAARAVRVTAVDAIRGQRHECLAVVEHVRGRAVEVAALDDGGAGAQFHQPDRRRSQVVHRPNLPPRERFGLRHVGRDDGGPAKQPIPQDRHAFRAGIFVEQHRR